MIRPPAVLVVRGATVAARASEIATDAAAKVGALDGSTRPLLTTLPWIVGLPVKIAPD